MSSRRSRTLVRSIEKPRKKSELIDAIKEKQTIWFLLMLWYTLALVDETGPCHALLKVKDLFTILTVKE